MMGFGMAGSASGKPGFGQLPVVGYLSAGARNSIADISGVQVGHFTRADGATQTGVTVIRPHALDPFQNKVPAGAAVINGFGKSAGLMQLMELGQIETPIVLTNTFAVPAMVSALTRACIRRNPETGRMLPTVNPLVLECNDGYLNDIQRQSLGEAEFMAACQDIGADFAQGAVGAGRGMSSFQLKGGIGSASRRAELANGASHLVGALVLANYGVLSNLVWAGQALGPRIGQLLTQPGPVEESVPAERGSIIMVLATDAPLCSRQLGRLAVRAGAGLARTGSVYGHGSGDVAVAFSSAYTLPASPDRGMPAVRMVHESLLDPLFQAAADSVEQAIIHALWHAEDVSGRDGHVRKGIRGLLNALCEPSAESVMASGASSGPVEAQAGSGMGERCGDEGK